MSAFNAWLTGLGANPGGRSEHSTCGLASELSFDASPPREWEGLTLMDPQKGAGDAAEEGGGRYIPVP